MTLRFVEAALWSIAITMTALAFIAWRRVTRQPTVPAPMVWPAASPAALPSPDSLAALTSRIVDGDVFRLDRKPAAIPYGAVVAGQAAGAPALSAPPTPSLTLAGLVGGVRWAALLDGVPGHDGSLVVHRGDSVAGLRVRAITPEGVILSGLDTTWHLTVKHPWP